MKLSRTAIKELTAAYRAVLKHALVASMGLVMIAPAVAVESLAEAKTVGDKQVLEFDARLKISSAEDGTKWDDVAISVTKGGTVNLNGGLTVANNILKDDAKTGILHNKMGTVNIKNGATFVGNTSSPNSEGFLRNTNPFPSEKIENPETIMDIAGDLGFVDNKLRGHTLLFNMGNFVAHDGDVVFEGNELISIASNAKDSYGAAIYNNGGGTAVAHLELLGNSNQFIGNIDNGVRNESQSGGAAIHNRGSINNGSLAEIIIGKEDGSSINKFSNNIAAYNGGAIVNRNYSTITFNGKTTFDGNKATGRHGGAIYNFSQEGESAGMTFNDDVVFNNNFAGGNGGAIWNGTDGADGVTAEIVFNKGATFTGNHAQTGGAIWNSGDITMGDGVAFSGNYVDGSDNNGGAIYNTGNITIGDKASFAGNRASVDGGAGGAIYNSGTVTIGDHATFTDNIADSLANGSRPYGGGDIFNNGGTVKIGDYLTMVRSEEYYDENMNYDTNIYSIGTGNITIGNNAKFKNVVQALVTEKGTFSIGDNAVFEGVGSAVATWGGNVTIGNNAIFSNGVGRVLDVANRTAGTITVGEKARFYNNANNANGAVVAFNGGTNSKMEFGDGFVATGNSTEGNSIVYNEGTSSMTFLGSSYFGYNKADNKSGAIRNWGDLVFNGAAVFIGNSDTNEGGALTNNGESSSVVFKDFATFTNNTTKSGSAGAIYNASDATLTFEKGAKFSGNIASGRGNDIHNLGVVNIRAGETTFASGVSGTGTLTVADGATMNIGTAVIEQGTLNIDGVVLASIVDSRSHGRLYADNYNIGENGVLKLNVGKVGTYSIFKENATNMNIDAGAAYVATQNADGTVLIETKALEDLSADTGLSVKAAGVVAGLANSGDRSLSMLSLRVQNALDAGHTDYIEQEAGKLNPTEKPVAHSVASSVQNQIMNTVTNRMAALGAVGRNGGDVNAEYGLWAHGLINKSKYGSQFHGTTRGTAIGLDALINRAFTIGAGYAYASTDMHSRDRTTDIDSNTLFVYGQYKPSKGYVNGALNYTKSKYQENIKAFDMGIASDHDVFVYGGQVMTGYDFSVGLTPEAGVRYLHISQDDYSNGLARVKGTDSNFVTGTAGMKYSFLIQDTGKTKWRPELRAAATYDFVSDDTAVTVTMPGAAPYVVDGDRLSRFGGEFGLGLSIECPGLTLALSYDLDLHEDYTSQTGMAKLKLMF